MFRNSSNLSERFYLREIPPTLWKSLQNVYLRNWPENIVGYYTLNNYIRWQRLEPNIKNLHIYTLAHEILNRRVVFDGIFIVIDRYQLFFNTVGSLNTDKLQKALSLLDWNSGYKVSTFLERHKEILMDVISSKKLTLEWGISATPMAYFKKEKAADINLNCPEDIDLKPLSEEDVIIANSLWPNRHSGSLFLLKRLAKLNQSIGAFKRDTGELVAWCFQLQSGALGALQVKEEHMRKGYGSLVVRAITKILAANNCDTFACVSEGNDASYKTFKKCGFEFIDVCNWLRTNPVKPLDIDWEKE